MLSPDELKSYQNDLGKAMTRIVLKKGKFMEYVRKIKPEKLSNNSICEFISLKSHGYCS